MKRPVCLFALCYLLFQFVLMSFFENETGILPFKEGEKLCFVGKVYHKSFSSEGLTVYLKELRFDESVNRTDCDIGVQQKKEGKYRGAICYMAIEDSVPYNQYPKIGSYIMVEGIYKPFYKATNQGQFDQKSYYNTQKIDFSITKGTVIKETTDYQWLGEELWQLKCRWQQSYENICTPKAAGFLTSVVLGDKKQMDLEDRNLFSNNGIAHILAVSGVHLSILGMGLYKLLRKINIPEWLRVIGSVLLIAMYGRMIHAGVATFRAILMFSINLCGKLFGRTYDMAVATAVAACVIVTGNAVIITTAGFVLSFMAILALLCFYPFVKGIIPLPEGVLQHMWFAKLWDSFLVSFSITFFLLPVQLFYYYEIYPYAILLNIIVLPLFSIVLYLGFAGGAVGIVSPFFGKLILLPCEYIFGFYLWICKKIELLPANRIIVGETSRVQMIVFYALLLGLIGLAEYSRRKKENPSLGRRLAYFLVCCMACFILCARIRWNTRIVFLDVGQGDCCVIQQKSGINILIDAGSSDVTSCGQWRLIPFLKSQGISRIDYAFLSHPDSDHYSALVECMETTCESGVSVKKLALSPYGKDHEAYGDIIEVARNTGCDLLYVCPGDTMTVGKTFSMTCLYPYGDEGFEDTNDQSMILKVQEGDFSMLFTGDMGKIEEQAFLDLYGTDESIDHLPDLLKVAHHGSSTSTSQVFLQCFTPKVAVISCGVNNQYGHPHKETLTRLQNFGIRTFVTNQTGQITVEIVSELNGKTGFRIKGGYKE